MNNIFLIYSRLVLLNQHYNFHTSSVINNTRPEMKKMRQLLVKQKINKCIICDKTFPLCLLDCAHLKPRSIISISERKNFYNLEFMCKCCHSLYDNGYIGIKDGYLKISDDIIKDIIAYNLFDNKIIKNYNQYNMKYFDYHYHNIYKSYKK